MPRRGVGRAVAWSKFSPREPPQDHLRAASPQAARRAWILRWGWRIAQGMFYLGIVFLLYWMLTRR
jgi:hypothetical protein